LPFAADVPTSASSHLIEQSFELSAAPCADRPLPACQCMLDAHPETSTTFRAIAD